VVKEKDQALLLTNPDGRDGRLRDLLASLLNLLRGLAHASLLFLGELGVATTLLRSLDLSKKGL